MQERPSSGASSSCRNARSRSGASSSCRNAREDQAAQPASMRIMQDESDDDHDERLIQVQVCYFSASEANSFPALKAIKIPASEAMRRP